MSDKQSLPPEEKEAVIEVSLRHVLTAFGGLIVATFSVGAGIVIVRDYTRYKRQKAIIDAATELLLTLQNRERSENWNEKKKPMDSVSTSPMTK